ncbi:MAG: FAD-dependent oxidoreductase [Sandaracinaceae bacterium]|nr:FAD-dependent oxidoreductase [Sandaracinaceae bacterium]
MSSADHPRVPKKKILILGGGLSALSAGIHLLEDGGAAALDVHLVCMEHRLGGKAASWRLPDGRYMEIGFHAVFGYYRAIQALLERVGRPVTDARYFTDNGGVHLMYESKVRKVNRLDIPDGPLDVGALFNGGFLGYEGMSFTEKAAAGAWMAKTGARLLTRTVDPSIDAHSFTAWCVGTGLDVELTRKSWFRYVLDLAFNYPSKGSAYVGMYGFQRLMGPEKSRVHYFNGPMSEVMIRPLAAHFLALGGTIDFCTKVTRVTLDPATRRVEELATRPMAAAAPIPGEPEHVTPTPLGGGYSLADAPYPVGEPAPASGSAETVLRHGVDYDEVVCTLPVDSLRALLRTTPDFERAVLDEPAIRRIWGLRTVASLSARVWFPARVMPADYTTVVMGTPQPAATVIDYKNRVGELRSSAWGSVVEFEGQEGRHGELGDRELLRELLRSFRQLPFVDAAKVDIDAVLNQTGGHRWDFRRNTASHLRYLLMEPGHWAARPTQDGFPYDNLTLAGDWMVGTQPTASMEAAVRTGCVAARRLRGRYGLSATASCE